MARPRRDQPLWRVPSQRESWHRIRLEPKRPIQLLLDDGTWCQDAWLHTWLRDPQGTWLGLVESYGHPGSSCGSTVWIPAERLRPREGR